MWKLSDLFDLTGSSGKSSENCTYVCALLHGYDSELILFIDPNEESFIVIVENASAFRPIAVKTTCIQESVTLLKEEVVSNQLLLLGFSHVSEWIERSSQISLEGIAGLHNFLLDGISLFSCDSGAKRIIS